ncbi:MAG: DNA repair protein RecO [Ruminococcaceae bacterium]|nr:DNA repair protein RecO [Oscillospiraceae bacterium]
MEIVHVKAIVLREAQFRENDKMLTCFSDKLGKISVSVRGAKKIGGRFTAVAQVFCYSDMELYRGKGDIYTLKDAQLIESFYGLREDLDRLTIAGKILKLAARVTQENLEDEESLRLLLNSLFYLSKGLMSEELIYCIYRMRLVSIQGYFPNVTYKFIGTEQAVEHICEVPLEKLFAFSVSDDVVKELDSVCEKLIAEMTEGV